MKFLLTSSCLLLLSLSVWAQKIVTGQIIGTDKEPIIGVAILEKGTASGTTTDIEGNFSLTVTGDSSVLIVSYIGFKSQEIPVAGLSNISVTLAEDIKELDEVVIVGYGTVRKSDLTGAVTSLKPEEVKQVPTNNVMDGIQGKAAGVDVTTTNGSANAKPVITIRGNRSITAGNDPLYIVDGVQYNSIQDINPNDILSMEVLKDASSTAIYGSRGSNGVVIVTTKKGAAGEIKVSINSYIGQSKAFKFPGSMNGEQYANLKREARRTNNITGDENVFGPAELANLQNGVSTDYTKELLHTGLQKDLQIGISGGNDKIKTYFSLDGYEQKGIVRNDNLLRYTGRLNLDYQVKKYLKVGTQTQITSYDQTTRTNPIGLANKINPLTTPYDENGNLIIYPLSGKDINPLIDEQPNAAIDKTTTLRIFPTVYAEFALLKGLTARTNFSVNWDNASQGQYFDRYSVTRNGAASQASHNGTYRTNINWQGILNYNKIIRKDHSFNLLGLGELVQNKTEEFDATGQNQLLPQQQYYNLNGNPDAIGINSYYLKRAIVSVAGRVNYSFKGKYLISITAREDGASNLAENKKWYFFPSVALGWRLSDERFMLNQKIFSTIKLRASYGIAGNSQVDPYSSQSVLTKINYSYDNTANTGFGYDPKAGNSALTWEKSKTIDVGLDLGILKERITATMDYYDTHTDDLLLYRPLPASSGLSSILQNVGSSRNRGVEVALNAVILRKKNFTWNSSVTFMRNKEQVLTLTDNLPFINIGKQSTVNGLTQTDYNTPRWAVVGSPANAFFDYEKVGIWQIGEEEEAAKYGQKPGDIHVKDQNGDGKITPESDRIVVGSMVPKWSGGFNSEFKFYGFDVSVYFYARIGQMFDYNTSRNVYDPTGTENSLASSDYWTPENPTNDLPRPNSNTGASTLKYYTTTGYKDGSFVKLRNATIGYTLPANLTDRFKISRLRVYVTGKNLALLYHAKDVKGYDPEMAGQLNIPSVRLYIVGVNLEF